MKCKAECGRWLVSGEKQRGTCIDCHREGTHGVFRCKTCGEPLVSVQDILDGVCSKPMCGKTSSTPSTTVPAAYGNSIGGKFTTFKTKCTHKGNPVVFKIGAGTVRAGGSKDMDDWVVDDIDIILRLSGHRLSRLALNEAAKEFLGPTLCDKLTNQFITTMPSIQVDWSDMGAPPFDREFVQDMVDLVDKGANMMVHCVGGHGRTGTMLVAMAYVANLYPEETDLVTHLRESYCESIVESMSQENWLRSLGVKNIPKD